MLLYDRLTNELRCEFQLMLLLLLYRINRLEVECSEKLSGRREKCRKPKRKSMPLLCQATDTLQMMINDEALYIKLQMMVNDRLIKLISVTSSLSIGPAASGLP